MHSIAWRHQNSQVKAALHHPCFWVLVFHPRKLSSPQKVLHNSRPISLGDSLNRWYLRQNKVSLIEFMRVHPFVKSILHSSMIQLPMIHSSQSLSLNKIQLIKTCLDPFRFLQLCFQKNPQRRNLYFKREDSFHPIHQWKWGCPSKSTHKILITM